MNLIHEDCDPTLAKDKKLPYTSYLVEYMREGRIAYDIATATSKVELFDEYYDKYKKDFVTMKQAEGIIRPNLWQDRSVVKEPPKKKRKRKPDNA